MASLDAQTKKMLDNGMHPNEVLAAIIRSKDPTVQKIVKKAQKVSAEQGMNTGYFLADMLDIPRPVPIDPRASNKGVNKNATVKDKARSHLLSAATGLNDALGGLSQGVYYAKDAIFGGDSYGKNKADVAALNRRTEDARKQAGRTGFDATRLGGAVAATIPGGGAGLAAKGAGLGKLALTEAAIGAGYGAAAQADSAGARAANMAIGGVAGGVLAPVTRTAGKMISKIPKGKARAANNAAGRTTQAAKQQVIQAADAVSTLRGQGTIASGGNTIPKSVIDEATEIADKALRNNIALDTEALLRQLEAKKLGVTLTEGQTKQNPMLYTQEIEAGKNNPLLNEFLNKQKLDVKQSFDDLSDTIGGTRHSPVNGDNKKYAGSNVTDALMEGDAAAKKATSELYDQVAASPGAKSLTVDFAKFADDMENQLLDAGAPVDITNRLMNVLKRQGDTYSEGMPLNEAHIFDKRLNEMLGDAKKGMGNASDERAINIVRHKLAESIEDAHTSADGAVIDAAGKETSDLYSAAKASHAARQQLIESIPWLKAATRGDTKDNAFDKFIINGQIDDVSNLIKHLSPKEGAATDVAKQSAQQLNDIRMATLDHIIIESTKGANGTPSVAALKRTLDKIGDARLASIFSAEQVKHIKDIQKVAHYVLEAPPGSAVNHSNTGSTVLRSLANGVNRSATMVAGIPGIGSVARTIAPYATEAARVAGKVRANVKAKKSVSGAIDETKNSNLGLTPDQLKLVETITDAPVKAGRVAAAAINSSGAEQDDNVGLDEFAPIELDVVGPYNADDDFLADYSANATEAAMPQAQQYDDGHSMINGAATTNDSRAQGFNQYGEAVDANGNVVDLSDEEILALKGY